MLAPRLREIIGCIKRADVLADIGCDHGYAVRAALEENRAGRAIAADISAPSLEKTEAMARRAGLDDRIELRLGDGLSVLEPGEADTILIAGMGGMTIRRILAEGGECARRAEQLILSPNRNEYEVRKFLAENGYGIREERLAFDRGRFYQIICASYGGACVEEDDFYYGIGRKLIENGGAVLHAFLRREIEKADAVVRGAARGKTTALLVEKTAERKRKMEEVLKGEYKGTGAGH